MKATLNLNRPKKPIEIRLSSIKRLLMYMVIILANIIAFVWGASAYKTDYDNRLTHAEKDIKDIQVILPEIRDNVSVIKGNVNTILKVITAE